MEGLKIVKDNGCWELDRATQGYYSQICYKGEVYRAHRISAAHYLDLDFNDKEQLACHKNECGNKKCWNPEHLYVGNKVSNMRDAVAIGNCFKGNR